MDGGGVPGKDCTPLEFPVDQSDRSGQASPASASTKYVDQGRSCGTVRGTVRQSDGLWYPPSAYLHPLAPPPPPPRQPGRHPLQPACSYHAGETPPEQWVYHACTPLPGGYTTYHGSMIALSSSSYDQRYRHGAPVMIVPFAHPANHAHQMHLWHAPTYARELHAVPSSYWSESRQSESWDDVSSSSDLMRGSGTVDSDLTSVMSPTFSPTCSPELPEAEDWGSLASSILQNILPKLAESDVKNVRLVCRHWQTVVDHNLEQLTPSTMMSKLIVMRFPNLKALHLTNCSNVRNRDLMIISQSGLKLHTLTLGDDKANPWVSNKGIACISKITTLTCLNLQDCSNVTNNGLLALSKLSILEALSLKGCQKLTNGGIEALQGNTALTSLNLFGCLRVADKGLLSLSNLNLVTLTLGCTRVKDEGLAYLAKMTSLQELHFEKEEMTDVGIKTLSSLTNLQSLALRDCSDVSGDSLSMLIPQLPNLMSLDLYKNFSIDDSQLSKCLEFLGSVTHLDLRGTFVTEDGLQELTRLSSLQKLCLAPAQNAEVWGEYMCVISNLTQLTSLTINSCQLISFPLAKSLRQLKQLQELDLSDEARLEVEVKPPVNHAAVDVMATITSLTSIDLSRRPVNEDHLSVLAERLPKLHMLIIVGCPVLSSEVQSLQRRFPELTIHRKPLPDVSCSSSDHGSSIG